MAINLRYIDVMLCMMAKCLLSFFLLHSPRQSAPTILVSVVYQRPKYLTKAKVFYYLAFGFGRRSFNLKCYSECENAASFIHCSALVVL